MLSFHIYFLNPHFVLGLHAKHEDYVYFPLEDVCLFVCLFVLGFNVSLTLFQSLLYYHYYRRCSVYYVLITGGRIVWQMYSLHTVIKG